MQTSQPQTYKATGSPLTDTFTGPTLSSVLNAAGGIPTNPAVKNDVLQTTGERWWRPTPAVSNGSSVINFDRAAIVVKRPKSRLPSMHCTGRSNFGAQSRSVSHTDEMILPNRGRPTDPCNTVGPRLFTYPGGVQQVIVSTMLEKGQG